jgi:hypothetical protein
MPPAWIANELMQKSSLYSLRKKQTISMGARGLIFYAEIS